VAFASQKELRAWMPVDIYLGGDEHNTLHLLYSRFIYLFLHDIGAVPAEIPEPYQKRLSHGVILGTDGKRMSKSRPNTVVPVETAVEKYGADVTRTYLMSIGPFDATLTWNDNAIMGVSRFLERFTRAIHAAARSNRESSAQARHILHQTIQAVGRDLEEFKFNTAVAKLMEGLNGLEYQPLSRDDAKKLAAILHPLAPFTSEALLRELGDENLAHAPVWPAFDPDLARETRQTVAVQVNGKLRGILELESGAEEQTVRDLALDAPTMARYINAGRLVKVIYIPGKTINFVVSVDH
jgi:leucyl-tRNA synthetase